MIIRRFFALCLLISAATATSSAWPQENTPRLALVIGNAGYPGSSVPLPTTVKDARAFADELRRNDFEVDLKENVNKEEMRRAIDAFTNNIRNGTTALLYFSGLGIQVARQTYLIPVNAPIWTESDVRRDGVNIDAVLTEMSRKGAKVKIVIIDASRNNPIEQRFRLPQTGLAAINTPDGTLAIATAAPGKVGNDATAAKDDDATGAATVFAAELIKQIRTPALSAEEAFGRAQAAISKASNGEHVPWVASTLVERFVFKKAAVRPAVVAPPPVPAPAPSPPRTPVSQVGLKPGDVFRDCPECGELVIVPAGSFEMGSTSEFEGPVHRVTIAKPIAIGRREVTFNEWDSCVAAGDCKSRLADRGWGRGDRPALNVTWVDAKQFVSWLSKKTGQRYRLPSESEWEYTARGGTTTPYWWGADIGSNQANCRDCKTATPQQTSLVGTFKPNPFGLYDTAGNVAEWVEDCWNNDYQGSPVDGSAWVTGQCRLRVLRGGSFESDAKYLRSASRFRYDTNVRFYANGFRVVREIP